MPTNYYREKNTITGKDDFFDASSGSYIGATQFGSGVGFAEVTKPDPSTMLANAVQGGGSKTKLASASNSGEEWTGPGVAPFSGPTYDESGNSVVPPGDGSTEINDFLKSLWGDQVDQQITTPDLSVERDRLETAKVARIQALDVQYAQNLVDLQRANKDVSGALKARLIKMGISPSDSAWGSAEAGQLERDRQSESRLRSEYMTNKARIESDVDAQLTNLTLNENKMKFDAQVANINNMLQKSSQGISLYSIFSQRDQSEKDREQKAYGDLLQYQGTMASLDQKTKEARAKTIMENAQKGYYNVSDEATMKMLLELEKELPDYLTGLSGIAASGLTDRLTGLAKTQLETEKIKWDIEQTKAQIAKLRSSGNSSGDKETKAMFDEAANQLGLLSSGKTTWETAFKTMKRRYNVKDEYIDDLLGGGYDKETNTYYGWAEEGHYEKVAAIRKNTQPDVILKIGN